MHFYRIERERWERLFEIKVRDKTVYSLAILSKTFKSRRSYFVYIDMLSFRQQVYFHFYSTDDNALNAFYRIAVNSHYKGRCLLFKLDKRW